MISHDAHDKIFIALCVLLVLAASFLAAVFIVKVLG